jgi:DNA-binding transcriptional ArsR family regulator
MPRAEAAGAAAGFRRERRPATLQEMRALASPLRLRILRLTLDEARTNKEIAHLLDVAPATVLHHIRTLVAAGFLAPEPERRGARNAREIPYRATRLSWRIDTADIDPSGAVKRASVQAFLAELAEVSDNRRFATARLGLRLSADRRADLEARLGELLEEFEQLPRDPDGEPFAVFLAIYPRTARS